MFCPNCGGQNPDNATFCATCGTSFAQQQAPVAPVYGGAPVGGYAPAPVDNPGKGLGIAGMILGIISLAFFCLWYLAIPCAVASIILSAIGMSKSKNAGMKNGMATAGLICSIISVALALIIVAAGAAFLADLGLL